MSYLAYLCFCDFEDDDSLCVTEFSEPPRWKYTKVIPIQFSPIHSWTDKDKELYFAKPK